MALGHPQRIVQISRDMILLLPLRNGFEIPTLAIDAKVWERPSLALDPDLRYDLGARIAHQALQNDMETVRCVRGVQLGHFAVWVFFQEVVVEVDVPPDGIQAVNLMQQVQLGDVGVGPQPERFWVLGHVVRVLAHLDDVFPRNSEGIEASEPLPGGVGGRAGRLAVDIFVVVDQ
jgi:hypothetical protein